MHVSFEKRMLAFSYSKKLWRYYKIWHYYSSPVVSRRLFIYLPFLMRSREDVNSPPCVYVCASNYPMVKKMNTDIDSICTVCHLSLECRRRALTLSFSCETSLEHTAYKIHSISSPPASLWHLPPWCTHHHPTIIPTIENALQWVESETGHWRHVNV